MGGGGSGKEGESRGSWECMVRQGAMGRGCASGRVDGTT